MDLKQMMDLKELKALKVSLGLDLKELRVFRV
jgi:hypothetical protein